MFSERVTQVRRRVKWASVGAAAGAGVGAVVNPKYAGAGGALGGTVGALTAEMSFDVEDRLSAAQKRIGDARLPRKPTTSSVETEQ